MSDTDKIKELEERIHKLELEPRYIPYPYPVYPTYPVYPSVPYWQYQTTCGTS